MPRARFLQEPSLGERGGQKPHPGWGWGTQGLCPVGWGTPGPCLYGMGHTRAVSPWDGALTVPCPHGLTLPLPPGERAGCAGQVRGQRGRLGGRRAVPLRGQPRVLSLRRAPLAPPLLPRSPPPPLTPRFHPSHPGEAARRVGAGGPTRMKGTLGSAAHGRGGSSGQARPSQGFGEPPAVLGGRRGSLGVPLPRRSFFAVPPSGPRVSCCRVHPVYQIA